jgi:hypothetical protein
MTACRHDAPEHSSAQGHPIAYADGPPSKLTITSMRLRRMGGYAAQKLVKGPSGPFYVRLRGHRPYGPNLSLEADRLGPTILTVSDQTVRCNPIFYRLCSAVAADVADGFWFLVLSDFFTILL